MTVLLSVVLTTFHLEDNYLVAFYERSYYLSYYLCALNSWCAYCDCSVVINQQNLVKLNSLAFFRIFDVVYEELLALLSLKLLTVNFYNCVHFFIVNGFVPLGG